MIFMMGSGEENGLEKGSSGADVERIYASLGNRMSERNIGLWLGDGAISRVNGSVYIKGDRLCLNHVKNTFGPDITEAVADVNKNWEVIYKVVGQRSLDFGDSKATTSPTANYSGASQKESFEKCLPYSWIGHKSNCFSEDPGVVLHEGNKKVHSHLENIADSASKGEKGYSSIIHGRNGLGKTFALNRLAYMLREQKVPTVAFGVDGLVYHLTPGESRRRIMQPFDPRCLDLLGDASVILLDQVHNASGGAGKWQLPGTLGNLFNLFQSAEKRGAYVVSFVTETPGFELDDFIGHIGDTETVGEYNGIGNNDFADRLRNSFCVEIKNVPKDGREDFVLEMISRNYTLDNSRILNEEIAAGIIGAGYGAVLNPRRVAKNIENLERLVGSGHTPGAASIVGTFGGREAKKKLERDGFGFAEKDFAGAKLRSLLGSSGFSGKEIRSAFDSYESGQFGKGSTHLDKEIGGMIRAIELYGEGDRNMGGYKISTDSTFALKKLVSDWKDPQIKLF